MSAAAEDEETLQRCASCGVAGSDHIQKVTKAFVRSFVRVFVRVFVPKIVEQFSSGAESAAQRMR